ncbi:LIM domain-containing protein A-like [Lethenteron reissneri]|uniref:LIM domain-containing protein A-like n=1 Tax=Lethenteron reissneri TaxID=7753 RepID=UPI002AB76193|nr:LIM domain-containing protein A-like [Lethenteron reissneri]
MGVHWQGMLSLSLIALITVRVAGESAAGHSRRVHRNHQASHSASHHSHPHGHRASRPQQHHSSPCDNGTGHPTDKGHPLGPVFQEQPVDTEFFEEQPDRTVTLHCCARANPPASYRCRHGAAAPPHTHSHARHAHGVHYNVSSCCCCCHSARSGDVSTEFEPDSAL